jgi:ABC-type tungstate transport system substrate-binding protein
MAHDFIDDIRIFDAGNDLTAPPHTAHTSILMANSRFKRFAKVIAARCSAVVASSSQCFSRNTTNVCLSLIVAGHLVCMSAGFPGAIHQS